MTWPKPPSVPALASLVAIGCLGPVKYDDTGYAITGTVSVTDTEGGSYSPPGVTVGTETGGSYAFIGTTTPPTPETGDTGTTDPGGSYTPLGTSAGSYGYIGTGYTGSYSGAALGPLPKPQ